MTARSRAALKLTLETDDKPTESEMADLVDSFPNIVDDNLGDIEAQLVPGYLPEFEETHIANGTDNYLMIPHIVRNPIDGTLITCYRIGSTHTEKEQYFFLRKSVDNGLTWTGLAGTGTHTQIDTVDYGQNWTPMFTKTGRLLIFYQYATGVSATRSDSRIIYSDDLGATWSAPYSMPVPVIPSQTMPTYFFDNNTVYNDLGNLITPFWVRVIELGRAVVGIAESSDNGETWDLDYSVVYDNSSGALGELSEHFMVDCGEGVIVMISRFEFALNPEGYSTPVLCTSKDYGRTWADGDETLLPADLLAKNHLSGFAYLEGVDVSMGDPDFNVTLPNLSLVEYDGEKWLFIVYYLRADASEFKQDLKVTCINLREFLLRGVDAIKTDNSKLPYLIHDYPLNGGGNTNGGNGSSIVLGGEILAANYNQTTVASIGGSTDLAYIFLSRARIGEMVKAYRTTGFNVSKEIVFNATESTLNFSDNSDAELTLTGDVTLLSIEDIPEEKGGTILIKQNVTGGYGIADIASSGLTMIYPGGLKPVAANINSGSNELTVLSFFRIGNYLNITY